MSEKTCAVCRELADRNAKLAAETIAAKTDRDRYAGWLREALGETKYVLAREARERSLVHRLVAADWLARATADLLRRIFAEHLRALDEIAERAAWSEVLEARAAEAEAAIARFVRLHPLQIEAAGRVRGFWSASKAEKEAADAVLDLVRISRVANGNGPPRDEVKVDGGSGPSAHRGASLSSPLQSGGQS